MNESLFLKYRPKEFTDLVGQDLSSLALQRMIELNRVPQGLLFSGPSGTGKTSAARILSQSFGGQVTEIDAASNRGVDHVRSLIDSLRYMSGSQVTILDEAHNLTREAFNAFLKTLEEPTPGTIFLLLTTEPHKIPDSVKSRLMEFEFRRISSSETLNLLMKVSSLENIEVPDSLLKVLAGEAQGNLRSALTSLEFIQLSGITSVSDYLEVNGKTDFAPQLVKLMCFGDYGSILLELDSVLSTVASPSVISSALLELYRDLLILRSGGSLDREGSSYDIRKELSVEIDRERLLSVVKLMWDLRTKLRVSDDPRGSLEMAVILMSDVLSQGKPEPKDTTVVESSKVPRPQKVSDSSEKMSLHDIQIS